METANKILRRVFEISRAVVAIWIVWIVIQATVLPLVTVHGQKPEPKPAPTITDTDKVKVRELQLKSYQITVEIQKRQLEIVQLQQMAKDTEENLNGVVRGLCKSDDGNSYGVDPDRLVCVPAPKTKGDISPVGEPKLSRLKSK